MCKLGSGDPMKEGNRKTRQFKADLCNQDFDWLIYRIMVYDIINYGTYHNQL